MKMVSVPVTFVLLCAILHPEHVLSRSKMREVESKFNLLHHKFTMLENKVFRDELKFSDEIDAILRRLKNTNDDDTDKHSDLDQTSTVTQQGLEALERIKAIQDGFEREKQYTRHYLKAFEVEFSDMKQMVKKAIADLFGKAEKNMIEMDKKLSDGSMYINDIRDEMEIKIDSIEQNFSKQFELNERSWHKMNLTIDELRQKVFGTSAISSDIQEKVKQIGHNVDHIIDKLFFECGSWAKFGMSCYKVFHETLSWKDAVKNCRAQEAYLVEIESSDEHTFLTNLFRSNETNLIVYDPTTYIAPRPGPWIGASDRYSEGKWVWDYSRRYLNYDSWYPGEPNGRKKENCVHMSGFVTYTWKSSICDETKPYICEKSVK